MLAGFVQSKIYGLPTQPSDVTPTQHKNVKPVGTVYENDVLWAPEVLIR